MQTYKRICITTHTVTDDEGQSMTVTRGKEYTTSRQDENGFVTVFSHFWVKLPVDLFSGAVRFTILLAALLFTGCATPPLLPSACCWRADAQVHGWCDVPNTDEVCVRPVGR